MNQINAHNVIPSSQQHQVKDYSWYTFDPSSKIDDVRVSAPSAEELRVLQPSQIDSQTRSIASSIAIDNVLHAQPVYSSTLPSSSIPITQSALPVDRDVKINIPMTYDTPIDINIGKSAPQEWTYEKMQSPMVPKESHKRKLESWIPETDVQEKEGLLEKKREVAPVDTEDLYDFTYVPRPEKQQLANKQREILATTPRDAVLLGKWYKLRKELGGQGYLIKPKQFKTLTLKHVEPNLYKSYWINRSTPSDIIDLEEKERQDRMERGANPLLLGKVHLVNKQLKSNNFSVPSTKGFSFTENIDAEKYKMKRQNKKPLGQWSSQYAWGTYVPRRVPVEIISLEEAEREWRSLKGANPLLLGKVHKINNQLKNINFVMPTGSNKGSFYALKRRSLGNNWDNTPITFSWPRFVPAEIRQMEEMERADRLTRGINPIIMGKLHLVHRELYTKTFAWAPVVGEMIKEQSANLAESIVEKGSDLVNAVVEEVPIVAEYVMEKSADLAEVVADKAPSMLENAEHVAGQVAHVGVDAAAAIGRFTFGLVGNFYESAKDKLGYVDHASLAYIHAAEEKERVERINKKVDPMVEAKKAHVQDQLLSMVKTAN